VKIFDLNLFIFSVNEDSAHHAKAKSWMEAQLNGTENIGIPWLVILGFLRIMTNGKIFPNPLSEVQATNLIDDWLHNPLVRIPDPEPGHWNLIKELILETGTAGNLTSDVHLAAIAIGHRAKLYSLDADFSRFKGLRWEKPF
jgi:uncharacterized protein